MDRWAGGQTGRGSVNRQPDNACQGGATSAALPVRPVGQPLAGTPATITAAQATLTTDHPPSLMAGATSAVTPVRPVESAEFFSADHAGIVAGVAPMLAGRLGLDRPAGPEEPECLPGLREPPTGGLRTTCRGQESHMPGAEPPAGRL